MLPELLPSRDGDSRWGRSWFSELITPPLNAIAAAGNRRFYAAHPPPSAASLFVPLPPVLRSHEQLLYTGFPHSGVADPGEDWANLKTFLPIAEEMFPRQVQSSILSPVGFLKLVWFLGTGQCARAKCGVQSFCLSWKERGYSERADRGLKHLGDEGIHYFWLKKTPPCRVQVSATCYSIHGQFLCILLETKNCYCAVGYKSL
jgi:hypothetical protein